MTAKELTCNPELDVNAKDDRGLSALHIACQRGHDAVVAVLLAHPLINVNLRTFTGETGFYIACDHNQDLVVRLLLADPRVLINLPKMDGITPLRTAARQGLISVVRWIIASGRDVHLGVPGHWPSDAIGATITSWNFDLLRLLEQFKEDPEAMRHEVREQARMVYAAEVFAQVVFVSDEYFTVSASSVTTAGGRNGSRFFNILSRLPLELQMTVCQFAFGINKQNIPGKDVERAIKVLAKENV